MNILFVEDDPELADQVSRELVRAGHSVDTAGDGPAALEAIRERRFDLMLLDGDLPGFAGFELLRRVRQAGLPVRILMLSGDAATGDQAAASKGVANGWLAKPFTAEELLARIDGLGGREDGTSEVPGPVLRVGSIRMEIEKRRVLREGVKIDLSPREFEVLAMFIQEPGKTFSRDEICERIWGREHEYDTRTVEISIMRLRKKLDRPGAESVIGTVRGVGYVMKVPHAE